MRTYRTFASYDLRLELLRKIKKEGYYVRMHAYEYLIGDNKRFLCILFIEPILNRVEIFVVNKEFQHIKRIKKIIREVCPTVMIFLREPFK